VTILVTGATGFLGQRVCRMLQERGEKYVPTSLSQGLDLRNRDATLAFFEATRPSTVLNCASFVGGIQFGLKYPADLFRNNMPMIANLFEGAHLAGVRRIVNPISNCVYPAQATLFREGEIWNGPLHETVMVYGLLRKMSWAGSWAYARQHGLDTLNVVLSNMYGPGDHFEEERSHALGALVMKFVEAKRREAPEVIVWGTGKPVREWLYVDDGAEALVRGVTAAATTDFVNVGVAEGVSVIDLAHKIKAVVGYQGRIVLDETKQDGAAFKTVDGVQGKALLKWSPTTSLETGIEQTVAWYTAHTSTQTKAIRS
jgi:GDP-L-fucose synthase